MSVIDSSGRLLPYFATSKTVIRSADSTTVNFSCPGLRFGSQTTFIASPQATRFLFCTCNRDFYRLTPQANCSLCPAQCSCVDDKNMSRCFPAMDHSALIPCPLLSDGSTACSARLSVWRFNGSAADVAAFCSEGHTGRLCSRCLDGYFEEGRRCLPCLSSGMQWLSILGFLVVLAAVITFLFVDSAPPDPSESEHEQSLSIKILLFHTQQLAILLSTQASYPKVWVV